MMKPLLKFLPLLLLIGCQFGNEPPKIKSNHDTISTEKITKVFNNKDSLLNKCLYVIDSLKDKIPVLDISKEFKMTINSDKNIVNKLYQLDKVKLDYLYSTDEVKQFYDFQQFSSYIYGRFKKGHNITYLFVLNSDFASAIYLDCFLLDKDYQYINMFRISYIEVQPNFSFSGKGFFTNDSTYILNTLDYEKIDNSNSVNVKASSKVIYHIDYKGKISKQQFKINKDTVTTR